MPVEWLPAGVVVSSPTSAHTFLLPNGHYWASAVPTVATVAGSKQLSASVSCRATCGVSAGLSLGLSASLAGKSTVIGAGVHDGKATLSASLACRASTLRAAIPDVAAGGGIATYPVIEGKWGGAASYSMNEFVGELGEYTEGTGSMRIPTYRNPPLTYGYVDATQNAQGAFVSEFGATGSVVNVAFTGTVGSGFMRLKDGAGNTHIFLNYTNSGTIGFAYYNYATSTAATTAAITGAVPISPTYTGAYVMPYTAQRIAVVYATQVVSKGKTYDIPVLSYTTNGGATWTQLQMYTTASNGGAVFSAYPKYVIGAATDLSRFYVYASDSIPPYANNYHRMYWVDMTTMSWGTVPWTDCMAALSSATGSYLNGAPLDLIHDGTNLYIPTPFSYINWSNGNPTSYYPMLKKAINLSSSTEWKDFTGCTIHALNSTIANYANYIDCGYGTTYAHHGLVTATAHYVVMYNPAYASTNTQVLVSRLNLFTLVGDRTTLTYPSGFFPATTSYPPYRRSTTVRSGTRVVWEYYTASGGTRWAYVANWSAGAAMTYRAHIDGACYAVSDAGGTLLIPSITTVESVQYAASTVVADLSIGASVSLAASAAASSTLTVEVSVGGLQLQSNLYCATGVVVDLRAAKAALEAALGSSTQVLCLLDVAHRTDLVCGFAVSSQLSAVLTRSHHFAAGLTCSATLSPTAGVDMRLASMQRCASDTQCTLHRAVSLACTQSCTSTLRGTLRALGVQTGRGAANSALTLDHRISVSPSEEAICVGSAEQ